MLCSTEGVDKYQASLRAARGDCRVQGHRQATASSGVVAMRHLRDQVWGLKPEPKSEELLK